MRQYMLTVIAAVVACVGCGKKADPGPSDGVARPAESASPGPAASASAGRPPETPAERLEGHRQEMAAAVDAGHYGAVCAGTPWFSPTICCWVAARAEEKSATFPRDAFQPFFVKEHIKKVYGRILSDADSDGNYEVSVSGYTHHCVLDTDETKYSSKGNFSLWVQEQPEPREVTVNSGAKEQWVVLEEATLAQMLLDLGHSKSGVEAKAMAKNAMALIAKYKPYAERKGETPAWPPGSSVDGGAPAAAGTSVSPTAAGATPRATAAPKAAPTAPPPVDTMYLQRVQHCCTGLHAAASTARGADLQQFNGAAIACDLVATQVRAGQRPDPGSVRSALRMSPMPRACIGTF